MELGPGYQEDVVSLYIEEHLPPPGLIGMGQPFEIYGFCVYSSSVIKIFNLQSDEDYSLKEINGIYKEVNLKWWQKVIRFISFGFFYSNESELRATIYDRDKLSFWQKAINFISFGYFYPTTARIDVRSVGKSVYRYKYSSDFNGKPVLFQFKQIKSIYESESKGESAYGWIKCKDFSEISLAIEPEESVILDDQKNKEEPKENKDLTDEKRLLSVDSKNKRSFVDDSGTLFSESNVPNRQNIN